MNYGYDITEDKPVTALDAVPTEETRFGCVECAAEAIYVSASESSNRKAHFRHGPYLIAAGWQCSLLSGKKEHKNSTKNYRKITELHERGHISKEQIWDYYEILLKNKDGRLEAANGANSLLEAKVRNLESEKKHNTDKWKNEYYSRAIEAEKEAEKLQRILNEIPSANKWTGEEWANNSQTDYLSPNWLNVDEDVKAEYLADKPKCTRGHDRIYNYIYFSRLEDSCRSIMRWVANPQTPEAVRSGQYIAKKVYENNSKFELQDLLGALVTTERNPERREVVQQFLKIILLETYEIQGKK
jgi:hypothetical protein